MIEKDATQADAEARARSHTTIHHVLHPFRPIIFPLTHDPRVPPSNTGPPSPPHSPTRLVDLERSPD